MNCQGNRLSRRNMLTVGAIGGLGLTLADFFQLREARGELKKYDAGLFNKPRWLVLNKLDMVPPAERAARTRDFVKRLRWKGPVFEISALTREGLQPMLHAIYEHVSAQVEQPPAPVDPRFPDAPAAPARA